MAPEQRRADMRRCARCGQPVRPERLIKGFGSDCAAFLGLTGGTVDIGQDGPDLFDFLREDPTEPAQVAVEP